MVSISVETPTGETLRTAYARYMQTALADAIGDAQFLVSDQRPLVMLRDCLGGLRAEVRWKDGMTFVKRTK